MKNTGIVAFGFGEPHSIRSNQRIAEIATRVVRQFNAPMYTQRDIRVGPGIDVTLISQGEFEDAPPTLRIARAAVAWAKERGLKNLIVVAAVPHMRRAMRDTKKAVAEIGAAIEITRAAASLGYPEDSWFCPESTQERVRSRKIWNRRERILKFMPFFLYKLFAS